VRDRGVEHRWRLVVNSEQRSLRALVSLWLAPDLRGVKVIEFRRGHSRRECYVRVEVWKEEGAIAMFFFRHRDGGWRVFPPERKRPTFSISS